MIRILFSLTLFLTAAKAQSLQEFHEALNESNAKLESAFTKYKDSLDLEWMEDSAKTQTLAELSATHTAWKAWASKEAELLGKLSGEGSNRLAREESVGYMIEFVDARTNYFLNAARGSTLPAPPSANAKLIQPKPGEPLRKILCDAFRPTISAETGVKGPIFVISTLNTMGDWAFINCIPKNVNGSNIDWSKTSHTEVASGEIDELAVALMAKDSNGQWQVVDYGIGASDVWWLGWVEQYKVPQKLLK